MGEGAWIDRANRRRAIDCGPMGDGHRARGPELDAGCQLKRGRFRIDSENQVVGGGEGARRFERPLGCRMGGGASARATSWLPEGGGASVRATSWLPGATWRLGSSNLPADRQHARDSALPSLPAAPPRPYATATATAGAGASQAQGERHNTIMSRK